MADDNDEGAGEKTEEPSSYRLDEFRKRGEVASSRELTSVVILAVAFSVTFLSLAFLYEEFSNYMHWIFSLDAKTAYSEKALATIFTNTAFLALKAVAPLFISVFCASLLVNVAQIGFLYAPDVLELKFDRIDPIQGFQRLFTVRSLVEALKAVFKFIVIISITYFFIKDELDSYNGFLQAELLTGFVFGKWIFLKVVFAIMTGLLIIAAGDFAYQKLSYRKKLMLTREEAKKEQKEHDGNPEIKQRIKTIQRQMAQKRMMADVPKADVIVTNPTHIAIALKYDPTTMVSPLVLAKGADNIALKIREIAQENGIPVVENVLLARTIFKTVKIGASVPRTLYKAVAEVLAFVYRLKRKRKQGF
jgi:flagellar biosynthetic protein FlhB